MVADSLTKVIKTFTFATTYKLTLLFRASAFAKTKKHNFNAIGKKLEEVTNEQRSTFFLSQNISIAIQRGNASCVMGTAPRTEGLDSIYYYIDHNSDIDSNLITDTPGT